MPAYVHCLKIFAYMLEWVYMPPQDQGQNVARNRYTWPVIIVVLVLLGVGVWFIYHRPPAQNDVGVLANEFAWTLTPATSAQGTTTAIQLRIAGVDVPVRSMPGTCVEVSETNWELLQDELSGVVCRDTSGNGAEIGIFQSGTQLVLKQGTVTGSTRTGFKEIQQAQ
jgi:hypothetical protein